MKTNITNILALCLIIFSSFTLATKANLKNKFKTRQDCFIPDPNFYRFDDNWRLQNGGGVISFKGKGRDVYIQLNNQRDSSSFQYWIIINGWDNTRTRVTRGDGTEVCFPVVPAHDLNQQFDYRLVLDPASASISIFIDGALQVTCTDPQGWNAPNVTWFSISKWCCADFQFCNFVVAPLDVCFIPDPNNYKFDPAWTVRGGEGDLTFVGIGRDVYIQLNNQMDSSSMQYWLVINGWDNTMTRLTRGDGSTVCFNPATALDLNARNNFRVIFNPSAAQVKVLINGEERFNCIDPNGWNASNAVNYSVSRYSGANFQFCNVKSEPLSIPRSFKLTGNLINATTGKNISPLNGGLIVLTGTDGKTYNGIVNADGTYTASIPAGQYSVSGSATDFITAQLQINLTGDDKENLILAPVVHDTTGRVVLKWNHFNPRPVDLDLYAINQRNKERVYYLAKRSTSGQLVLDVDNLVEGPETVTVRQDATDNIQIFVRNYNKAHPLNASEAEVDIYRGNDRIAKINVPVVAGQEGMNTWDIGTYNAGTGAWTEHNVLSA
jgi:hypothetical protein